MKVPPFPGWDNFSEESLFQAERINYWLQYPPDVFISGIASSIQQENNAIDFYNSVISDDPALPNISLEKLGGLTVKEAFAFMALCSEKIRCILYTADRYSGAKSLEDRKIDYINWQIQQDPSGWTIVTATLDNAIAGMISLAGTVHQLSGGYFEDYRQNALERIPRVLEYLTTCLNKAEVLIVGENNLVKEFESSDTGIIKQIPPEQWFQEMVSFLKVGLDNIAEKYVLLSRSENQEQTQNDLLQIIHTIQGKLYRLKAEMMGKNVDSTRIE
jgi:hypothetical protein